MKFNVLEATQGLNQRIQEIILFMLQSSQNLCKSFTCTLCVNLVSILSALTPPQGLLRFCGWYRSANFQSKKLQLGY